jgi:hypothetical protein
MAVSVVLIVIHICLQEKSVCAALLVLVTAVTAAVAVCQQAGRYCHTSVLLYSSPCRSIDALEPFSVEASVVALCL